jgi:hypothetical protein
MKRDELIKSSKNWNLNLNLKNLIYIINGTKRKYQRKKTQK